MVEKKLESEVISLLLNFEKKASILVDEALIEAEKRISDTKISANSKFQHEFNQMIQKMESDYNDKVLEIQKEHEIVIQDYKLSLENKNQNKEKFFTFLDSIFFNPNSI